jgi:hypothetical protein
MSPTYRERFRRINGAPLAWGAVHSASSRDTKVFAHERYVLSGAIPDATIEVRLLVYPFDPTCSSRPLLFAATPLHTDRRGDGSAGLAIRREDVPGAVRNASHGLRWEIWHGDVPLYRTGCVSVTVSDGGSLRDGPGVEATTGVTPV